MSASVRARVFLFLARSAVLQNRQSLSRVCSAYFVSK